MLVNTLVVYLGRAIPYSIFDNAISPVIGPVLDLCDYFLAGDQEQEWYNSMEFKKFPIRTIVDTRLQAALVLALGKDIQPEVPFLSKYEVTSMIPGMPWVSLGAKVAQSVYPSSDLLQAYRGKPYQSAYSSFASLGVPLPTKPMWDYYADEVFKNMKNPFAGTWAALKVFEGSQSKY